MRKLMIVLLSLSLSSYSLSQPDRQGAQPIVATYSIVAWDSLTGDLGVAVQSKFLAVGAVVPFAKAGVGAVATQAFANTNFGPRGLEMLEQGMTAEQVVASLIQGDSSSGVRQLGIVDSKGNAFSYTGSKCQEYAGHVIGSGYCAQGNILASEAVVKAIGRTFEITPGDLADRMLAALDAGERAGGDRRGKQSAAMLVVRDKGGYAGFNDRYIDLRVDDDSLPLVELHRLYTLWKSTFLVSARMRTVEEFNKQGKFSASREILRRAIDSFNADLRSNPDDPDLLNSIAWTLATNDIDRERALEIATRAAKLAPTKNNIRDTMAECHYRLGHFDEAIAIESELVSKEPANDDFWKQLQKFREAKQKSVR